MSKKAGTLGDVRPCEVCGINTAAVVSAVPGVPMAAARCGDCIMARAWPYWTLVANTAACDGLQNTMEFWRAMVTETLEYLGKDREQFDADVERAMEWCEPYDISS